MGIEKINVGEGYDNFYWGGGGVRNFQRRLRFFWEGLKFFRLELRCLQFQGDWKTVKGWGLKNFREENFKKFRRRVEKFPGGVDIFSGVVEIFLSDRDGFGRGWDYLFEQNFLWVGKDFSRGGGGVRYFQGD